MFRVFLFTAHGLDGELWLQSLLDYLHKCQMPLTGERSSQKLNELLRQVAEELNVEREGIENEIFDWRKSLGRFVATRQNLGVLVRNQHQWNAIQMDPMV